MVKRKLMTTMLIVMSSFGQYAKGDNLFEEEELLSDFYGDEQTVSIATGAVQPIYKAPAVASVITAKELVETGARDIDSALERVPGLHVSRDHIGNNPIYTFRGIYSGFNPQVLMLINGVPITNLYIGDRSQVWGGMPVEAVSRIEVIRGPGSALYGADAFAGVINIVLKQGSEIEKAQAGVRYGSYDTQEYWYVDGGEKNDLEWMFSLEYSDSDGSDEKIKSDLQSQIDAALALTPFATSASLAPGEVNKALERYDIRGGLKWENFNINIGLQKREGENYAGIGQALDSVNVFSSEKWNIDLNYVNDTWFENWEISGQAAYFHTTQEVEKNLVLFPPGSTGPTPIPLNPLLPPDPFTNPLFVYQNGVISNPEVYETHTRLKVNARYTGIDKHDITLGTGYYYGDIYKTKEEKNYTTLIVPVSAVLDQLLFVPLPLAPGQLADVSDTPLVFLPEGDRENYYFLLQDVWHFSNDWELTAGIRYDDYSDFGSTVNPRLALVWSTSNNLTTKFLYGSAFRAPSFAETTINSNPVALGNSDLDPETLDSYEIAFDYRPTAKVETTLNFFYYKWQDIIQFVPEGIGIARAQNVGEQTGYGSEFEITWRPSTQFDVRANLALQKSEDETTNEDAANAPEKQVYMQANWRPVNNWEFSLQGNWVMDRQRASNDLRSDIDDYFVMDLTLRKTNLLDGLDAAVIVSNLFDENAYEPSRAASDGSAAIPGDLPLQGRMVLGELRYNF